VLTNKFSNRPRPFPPASDQELLLADGAYMLCDENGAQLKEM